jgi:hypothetical protein
MIRLCHYVTHCILLIMALLVPLIGVAADQELGSDLERIEQQILLTRNQLTQVSAELRDAKVLAAEKMMEYEASRDAFQHERTAVSANSLDHAQQRLALAEMGVESKAARFERIQRKLKELADAKQEILAEPPTVSVTERTLADIGNAIDEKKTAEKSAANPPTSSSANAPSLTNDANAKLAPVPLVKKMLQQGAPVLTQQGKVSDIYQLNAELQKLEHHLVTHGANSAEPIQVKVYGTAITGEIPLAEMGGNQFFARFPAPSGTASLIIGARHKEGYVRTELQMTFSPEETGKDFVLIFDINTKEQPRALVFQESLAFTQEMFASHSDY